MVFAALMLPAVSLAAEFRAGDQPSIQASERIANDIYIAGGNVTSAGVVTGDVVAGGGNIVISGDVGADIIAGGGNVTILSTVGDDVRVGGGTILIQGKVGGDVIVGGGQITLGGPGIMGDVVIGAGSVRIDAPVAGSVKIGGGNVYINAPITGDVQIEAESVTLGSATVISGTLTYKASKELTKEEGAVVRGKVDFTLREKQGISAAALAALFSIWIMGKFLALLACALILGLVFRRYSKEIVAKAVKSPLLELGRGLVVIVALPAVSLLLFVTIIGIPLGVLGVISFVAVLLFAWIVTPIIVGSVVYRYFSKRDLEISWRTILLGALICTVVGMVPVVGGVVQLILMLLSVGVLVAIKWEIMQEWR